MSKHDSSGEHAFEKTHDGYTIRRFEHADLDAFLSLHADVFGTESSEEWFAWKFADNPYLDGVPVFVAEDDDDELVGGLGCFGLAMGTGAGSVLAVEPCDAVVHPDHRRRGLYLELMRAGMTYYGAREPTFYFDLIPGSGPYRGNHEHLDWNRVDELATYYRVQNPAALLDERLGDGVASGLAGGVGRLAARGYHALLARASASNVAGIDVERRSTVPADVFASLYRAGPPHRFHARRDEQFYRWRFANPRWEYAAYVAWRGGAPVAGMITGTGRSDDSRSTRLMDVVPMTAGVKRRDAFAALLSRVVDDHRDSDVLAAPPGVVPHGVLTAYGFRRDDVPPISRWAEPYRHGVRPFAGGEDAHVVDGMDLTDHTNWLITFAEQDTS